MSLRYLPFRAFQAVLFRFSAHQRAKRARRFIEMMAPRPGMRVIDLGGQPESWADIPGSLDITIVNLPGIVVTPLAAGDHSITLVEGDACNLAEYEDQSFDLAFSNSVIEHVGDAGARAALAQEARRLAPAYWVQTPSIWFPMEAHTGMPFWWFYPKALRDWLKERWRRKLPAWTEMIDGTTVLKRREIETLFPEGRIWTERVAGFPKSYIAWHR
ncbi:MAG: methyltransferase domain-containing protein [Pseudomonadota bacterium]